MNIYKGFLKRNVFIVGLFFSLILGTNGYYQSFYFFEDATAQVLNKVLLDQKNIKTEFGLYNIREENGYNLLSPLKRLYNHGQPNDLETIVETIDIEQYNVSPYKSAYGLQGIIVSGLYKLFKPIFRNFKFSFSTEVFVLQFFIGFISSIVFASICYLLFINFKKIYSITYFIFFFCSPFINMFSFNLYFFTFLWFLPILITLTGITFYRYKNFIFLLLIPIFTIKGLTSFEFLSSIMLSSFVPIIILLKEKKYEINSFIKDILLISVYSLMGVISSFLVFSFKKGNSILDGLRNIYYEDVLRRTIDISEFSDLSFLNIISKFSVGMFSYENILIHVNSGILFLMLIFTPLISFNFSKKKLIEYFFYLFIPFSWIILAFNHSYIHYFGVGILFFLGTFQYLFIESFNFIIKGLEKK